MFLFFNLFSKHFLLESKRLLHRQVKPSFSKKLTFENGLHAKSANDTNERAKEVCLHGISRFSMKSNFKNLVSRENLPLIASIRKGMGNLMSSYLYIMY